MMAVGVEQYAAGAKGATVSLVAQAKAKGDFAQMDLLGGDSSDEAEKEGIKPAEVAQIAMRKLRARRKSVSEGVQALALGAVDPRSPVIAATAEALQTIQPEEPYAEAISTALLAAHKDALQAADKADKTTASAGPNSFTHRIDMSRRNKACEEVGKALQDNLPAPLAMIGASLKILEDVVGAKASAYFQAVPSARILLRHTRQQCKPDSPHAAGHIAREMGESNIHVPYGKGVVGIAADRKASVNSAGGTLLYEDDVVMTNDGGSGFSGLQGCALAVPMLTNAGELIGVLGFTRENSSLPRS